MKLIKYLPKYYAKSRVMQEILSAFEAELETVNARTDSVQDELRVNKADEYLSLHELDVGLESYGGTGTSGDITTRRGRVLSRLRGTGTATKAMIKNVIASFVDGGIEIVEHSAEFRVEIIFIDYEGTPPDSKNIQLAIEEIKPAHLVIWYIQTFETAIDDVYIAASSAGSYTKFELPTRTPEQPASCDTAYVGTVAGQYLKYETITTGA